MVEIIFTKIISKNPKIELNTYYYYNMKAIINKLSFLLLIFTIAKNFEIKTNDL